MKTVSKLLSLTAFLCILLSACQKEVSLENGLDPIDPPVTTNDSIYIDKYYYVFTSGGILDTGGIANFHYDGQKRIKSLSTYIAETTPNPVLSDSMDLFYQGNDTLPYRVMIRYYNNGAAVGDTVEKFFSYDAQGRKIKDSTFEHFGVVVSEKTIVNFTYSTNKMYGQTNYINYNFPSESEVRRDTAILSNGNILSNKKYIFNGSSFVFAIESNFTYDNYNSPFILPSLYAVCWGFPTGETIEFEYSSKNNMLSQSEQIVYPTVDTYNNNTTHLYTGAWYPKRSTGIGSGIILYTYRVL